MKGELIVLICAFTLGSLFACGTSSNEKSIKATPSQHSDSPELDSLVLPTKDQLVKIEKTKEEWQSTLNDAEFYVLREKGTERAFTGSFWDEKRTGTYVCNGCQLPLFSSETKFKSGTGWPSFYTPIEDYVILEESDNAFGMQRVEVLCARCDGHLGHVFNDGPKPTGLRYCINSVSLDFKPSNP